MRNRPISVLIGGTAATLFAAVANAHTGLSTVHGFTAGVLHPLSGPDHIAFAIGVGVCAGRRGIRSGLMSIFILSLLGGGVLALLTGGVGVYNGLGLVPECLLVASVLAVGLLLLRRPADGSIVPAVIGLGALLHGYVHVAEASTSPVALSYLAGLAGITLVLACGGLLAHRHGGRDLQIATGLGCIGLGLAAWVGV